MSPENKDIEILEAYIQDQLDKSTAIDVRGRLQNDSEFANLYQWLLTVSKGSRLHVLKEKMDYLHGLEANRNTSASGSSWKHKYLWRILIGVLLLVLSIWGIYNYLYKDPKVKSISSETILPKSLEKPVPTKLPSNDTDVQKDDQQEEIYASKPNKYVLPVVVVWKSLYSIPEQLTSIFRSDHRPDTSVYNKALNLYKNQKYAEAIELLNSDKENQESRYLMAHSLLFSGNPKEAADIFYEFINNEYSVYYDESKWYYVLALYADYPTTKDKLSAAFQEISDFPDEYQKKVATIRKACKC